MLKVNYYLSKYVSNNSPLLLFICVQKYRRYSVAEIGWSLEARFRCINKGNRTRHLRGESDRPRKKTKFYYRLICNKDRWLPAQIALAHSHHIFTL